MSLPRTSAFMRMAAARPSMMGAVLPSSRSLADAMARAADGAEMIVELGAGTGAITSALRRRHPEVPMVAAELQHELAQHLAQRFPGLDVRSAPAHAVLRELDAAPQHSVVVSSLPFRSLPARWRRVSSTAIEAFLLVDPRRHLVQYTYQPRVAPFDLACGDQLRWRRHGVVWRNAPPAWLWQLSSGAA